MKYETDGHVVEIKPEELRAGCVIRRVESDGGVSPFADMTVLGIFLNDIGGYKNSYPSLEDALVHCKAEKLEAYRISIPVARPHLSANTVGILSNWLVGVEKFDIHPGNIKNYKMVVMSTGKPASYTT